MALMMSFAMSRGRSVFVIAAPSCIAVNHDRGFAAVRVRHPRASQVQHRDDGLRGVGAGLGQDGVGAPAAAAGLPDWVVDPGRPVPAAGTLPPGPPPPAAQPTPITPPTQPAPPRPPAPPP